MVQGERAGGVVPTMSSVKKMQQTKSAREARKKCSDTSQKTRLREAVKQSSIDRTAFAEMWNQGVSAMKMARHFGISKYYVKLTAQKFGLPDRVVVPKETHADRVCKNCYCYPCFSGIDNLDTNLAETCQSYREQKQGV